MELYCEQQYKRSIIQSSLSIGSLLGLIIMNIVSDLKGRKTALLIDLCLGVSSSLCKYMSYASNVYWRHYINYSTLGICFYHEWI